MTSAVRPGLPTSPPPPTARRAPSPRAIPHRLLKPLTFAICLLPAGLLAWRAWHGDLGANPIEKLELETGRWTLRLLAATLAVSPLRRLTGWNGLIKYRRMLGLFVFFYATLHVGTYLGLDYFFAWGEIWKDVSEHLYITVGAAAFLTLLPLAVTSTKGWIRRLGGRRWQRLHRLVYITAVAGTVHYLWAVKKDTATPLVYLSIFAVLLGARLWMWARRASG